MNRKAQLGIGVAAAGLLAASSSAQTYVGSFQTDDGPNWTTIPDVLSGLEAAALIFGGSPGDYLVSTDRNVITNTAWYTTIGIGGGQELDHAFSLDGGGVGYGAANWVSGEDVSTYVDDNAIGDFYTNYVFLVPAPGAASLFGLAGLAAMRRRR